MGELKLVNLEGVEPSTVSFRGSGKEPFRSIIFDKILRHLGQFLRPDHRQNLIENILSYFLKER